MIGIDDNKLVMNMTIIMQTNIAVACKKSNRIISKVPLISL